jgi:hypothetical protein
MEEGGRVWAWSVVTGKSVLAGEVGEELSADRRAQCEKGENQINLNFEIDNSNLFKHDSFQK